MSEVPVLLLSFATDTEKIDGLQKTCYAEMRQHKLHI